MKMASSFSWKCCIPYCDISLIHGVFPIPTEPGSSTSEWFKKVNQMQVFSVSHPLYIKEKVGAVICPIHFTKSDITHEGSETKLAKNVMPTYYPWSPQWPLLPKVKVFLKRLFIIIFLNFLMRAYQFLTIFLIGASLSPTRFFG